MQFATFRKKHRESKIGECENFAIKYLLVISWATLLSHFLLSQLSKLQFNELIDRCWHQTC